MREEDSEKRFVVSRSQNRPLFFSTFLSLKIRVPSIVRVLFPGTTWRIKTKEKKVFLTFDDGPIPEVTPWILDCLKRHNAVATFFCIGDNVRKYPEVFEQLRNSGMGIGNHTFSHCRAWKNSKEAYFADIDKCEEYFNSHFFRPPHGELYPWWIRLLKKRFKRIVMWDILSLDYEQKLSPAEVVENVITRIRPGAIIVFHDSLKAWDRLQEALPQVLEYLKEKSYSTEKLN